MARVPLEENQSIEEQNGSDWITEEPSMPQSGAVFEENISP